MVRYCTEVGEFYITCSISVFICVTTSNSRVEGKRKKISECGRMETDVGSIVE